MAFRMVEVITGKQDGGYTEIKLLSPLSDDTQIVMNAAYYLLADMKKEETEHEH
jgi:cobalt-zinc-cadmium efflux system membrane fusion protein